MSKTRTNLTNTPLLIKVANTCVSCGTIVEIVNYDDRIPNHFLIQCPTCKQKIESTKLLVDRLCTKWICNDCGAKGITWDGKDILECIVCSSPDVYFEESTVSNLKHTTSNNKQQEQTDSNRDNKIISIW